MRANEGGKGAWRGARRAAAHLKLLAVAALPVASELAVDVPILGDVGFLVVGRERVPFRAELLEAAEDGDGGRRAAHVHVSLDAQRAAKEARRLGAWLGGEERLEVEHEPGLRGRALQAHAAGELVEVGISKEFVRAESVKKQLERLVHRARRTHASAAERRTDEPARGHRADAAHRKRHARGRGAAGGVQSYYPQTLGFERRQRRRERRERHDERARLGLGARHAPVAPGRTSWTSPRSAGNSHDGGPCASVLRRRGGRRRTKR